jgi:hypothetical protein
VFLSQRFVFFEKMKGTNDTGEKDGNSWQAAGKWVFQKYQLLMVGSVGRGYEGRQRLRIKRKNLIFGSTDYLFCTVYSIDYSGITIIKLN